MYFILYSTHTGDQFGYLDAATAGIVSEQIRAFGQIFIVATVLTTGTPGYGWNMNCIVLLCYPYVPRVITVVVPDSAVMAQIVIPPVADNVASLVDSGVSLTLDRDHVAFDGRPIAVDAISADDIPAEDGVDVAVTDGDYYGQTYYRVTSESDGEFGMEDFRDMKKQTPLKCKEDDSDSDESLSVLIEDLNEKEPSLKRRRTDREYKP